MQPPGRRTQTSDVGVVAQAATESVFANLTMSLSRAGFQHAAQLLHRGTPSTGAAQHPDGSS